MTRQLANELIALGFKPVDPTTRDRGDFECSDDADGKGPYITRWLSQKPCPFPELLKPK